jgi:hypothetical protein
MKHFLLYKTPILVTAVILLGATLFSTEMARAESTSAGVGDVAVACLKAAAIQGAAQEIEIAAMAIFETAQLAAVVTSVPISNIPITIAAAQTAIWEQYIRGFEDCMVYGLGQIALNKLNRNTIDWIQKGLGGNPLFATMPFQIYLDTSGAVAGGMASHFGKIPVTEFVPGYQQRVQNQISLSTRQDSSKKFEQSITPTLPEGVVPQDFYNDFNAGGWDAYMASLYDNNNGYGVELLTSEELDAQQQEAYAIQQQKLAWSGGFIDLPDTERCEYPDDIRAKVESADPEEQYDPAQLAAVQRMYCPITTPGKVVGEQTTATINNDIERYGFIDTLSKLVNQFMVQMSTQATHGIF